MLNAAASAGVSAGHMPENKNSGGKSVKVLVAENAVMIFGRKGCCLCHVVQVLLQGHGVNPTILVVDDHNEADLTKQWPAFLGIKGSAALPNFPAVFVGGELFGGLDEIMGAHISGELVPKLRAAGALWL